MRYLLYLNRWNFNIDYLWLSSPGYLDGAVESAICEARRLGGRYVTIATGEGQPGLGGLQLIQARLPLQYL
jgi:hypothetical protein